MAEETGGSLPVSDGLLRWVYVAGIGLNLLALTVAVRSGQTAAALTLGLVIVYLGARLWLFRSG
ncbi:hypothetical protein GRX03_02920 [Halovenus sp. WSH3]|uniref:Uncharacterized protein n=1 Tax=Halovenus carboxidivorans TaxID=2692199 RepID=A0A6B0T5Q9_9EURY|nr:hypothetical protein [Halovenus carboxidivorans]MXR50561.1 hypothetical protein [Halovenus carboxidivorans]